MSTTPTHTADQIATAVRTWSAGMYTLEAGAELLIRTGLLTGPWLERDADSGRWWIDSDQITDDTIARYSGGERRVLKIAGSLLGGGAVSLADELPGLDRAHLALVLAAMAHAGGSHEHSGGPAPDPEGRWMIDGVRHGFPRLGSLFAWPETEQGQGDD